MGAPSAKTPEMEADQHLGLRRLRRITADLDDLTERRLEVIAEARAAGASWAEIAEACGFSSRSGAFRLVKRAGRLPMDGPDVTDS